MLKTGDTLRVGDVDVSNVIQEYVCV